MSLISHTAKKMQVTPNLPESAKDGLPRIQHSEYAYAPNFYRRAAGGKRIAYCMGATKLLVTVPFDDLAITDHDCAHRRVGVSPPRRSVAKLNGTSHVCSLVLYDDRCPLPCKVNRD